MAREVYNEGRVVGMSAYEIYLRHLMSEYPEMEPVTEREWLASTIGQGCSMIMRIPKNTPAGIFERQLPDNSSLCAASNITACVFDGKVELDATGIWGTQVTSYGPLISNTKTSHPVTPGENATQVPLGTDWTEEQRAHLKEYMKVIDGIVYQPGVWNTNEESDQNPFMDLKEPDLNKRGVVRLKLSKALDRDVLIVITGWVHRSIVAGSTKIEEGALNLIHPWNGDFMGAERFPWAVKIYFTVPTEVMHILNDKAYVRQLVTGTASKAVESKAIIDYDSDNIQTFYASGDSSTYPKPVADSRIPITVDEINVTGDGASVIGAYQRTDLKDGSTSGANYPPILYGVKATNKGAQTMVPIDTGAPGTVKIFENKAKAISYPKVIPNTYSFWHDKNNHSIYFIEGDTIISMDTKLETKNIGTAASPKYASIVKSGDKQVQAISLLNDSNQALNTDGTSGTISVYEENNPSAASRNLSWTDLLAGLGLNKKLDLIGEQLHRFRKNLPNVTSGSGGILSITGTGASSIAGSLSIGKAATVGDSLQVTKQAAIGGGAHIDSAVYGYNAATNDDEFKFNKPMKSGANYITFSNGLRLYISSTAPSTAGVPVGSIGIGW